MSKWEIAFWTMKLYEKFNKNYKTKWPVKLIFLWNLCLKPQMNGVDKFPYNALGKI